MRYALAAFRTDRAGNGRPRLAQANPQPPAPISGFRGGGGSNCYFMTLQQCQATISGVGGTCRPNPFFTGNAKEQPKRRSTKQPS